MRRPAQGREDGGSSGYEQVRAQPSPGPAWPITGGPHGCARSPAGQASVSATAPGSLSFRRIVDIPFETCVAALDSWQRTGHDGELRLGESQLLGPMERDRDSGTHRLEVRLARGPVRPILRMRLDIDRWSSSSTALELIPCGRIRPTAAYFQAGHLLLDSLTRSLPQHLPPAQAPDTASQAHVPVDSGRRLVRGRPLIARSCSAILDLLHGHVQLARLEASPRKSQIA